MATHHDVIVTHGNGPQVGLLALQSDSYPSAAPTPLDVLGAESEGMIGYLLDQELLNALPGRAVATLLTQTAVDAGDPAFLLPTKPIGPMYTADEAQRLAAERRWWSPLMALASAASSPPPNPARSSKLARSRCWWMRVSS